MKNDEKSMIEVVVVMVHLQTTMHYLKGLSRSISSQTKSQGECLLGWGKWDRGLWARAP